jgi:alpha-beta hydrolase superfamily lysophospholipase
MSLYFKFVSAPVLVAIIGIPSLSAAMEVAPQPLIRERHIPLKVDGGIRDMIVAGERSARAPAILLIGGLGCYSLPKNEPPYGALLQGLASAGYVTARVDKTGEGRSSGPSCSSESADLKREMAGYIAGLQALSDLPSADPDRVFIFAHSLGPLEAPGVARAAKVRGIIAAETAGKGWFDYELEIIRAQPLLLGQPYDEVERSARIYERCLHRFYIEKASSSEVKAENPACQDILVPGVPDSYLHQVADIDLASDWKQVDVPVLVIYGGSDPATSAEESRYLVDLINSFHPSQASYVFIPGMGHALNSSPSAAQFLKDHGGPHPTLHPQLLPVIKTWLTAHGAGI